MSDNVNVNSDVIIDAEFVPKTIIAEKELPPVTSGDAGKVATVDENGNWTVDDVPKELPAVTAADYEKELMIDAEGNWVVMKDEFHVDDLYCVPSGIVSPIITTIIRKGEPNEFISLTMGITFNLPKYVDENVNDFEFAEDVKASKIFLVAEDGTFIASNATIESVFNNLKGNYTVIAKDYISCQGVTIGHANQYYDAIREYTSAGKVIYLMMKDVYIRFKHKST